MSNIIGFNKQNILFVSNEQIDIDSNVFKKDTEYNRQKIREKVEPWLTAVFQSEHLSLLVGSGLTIALAESGTMMGRIEFGNDFKDLIKKKADEEASSIAREEANFEDDLRIALELLKGYEILKDGKANKLKEEINEKLKELLNKILEAEKNFIEEIIKTEQESKDNNKENKLLLLEKFLLSFSTRTATRDRLNIFTTNYDRFIEFGLDEAGILTLDRFIGKLNPIMRFHRVDLDYHYNPPGIRGEPRYVEGVVRYAKLHGSVDWQFEKNRIIKIPLPFGSDTNDKYFDAPFNKVVIYPNSAKAIETSFFPYSELFRDFSTAICRPNSVLITYGYGFGDSHINRIIKDMLTIPSTHLVIISYDWASDRIKKFIEDCNESQLTLLIGPELGNFENLTNYYLPKPAIDRITDRQIRILEKRNVIQKNIEDQDNMKIGDTNEP
ncbi:MAG TPA: SIR2 family protein [Syntrophorhabdaceae bacterium]|nr:SIR2 family protein [Syntrophorhabdaceae bacterium]